MEVYLIISQSVSWISRSTEMNLCLKMLILAINWYNLQCVVSSNCTFIFGAYSFSCENWIHEFFVHIFLQIMDQSSTPDGMQEAPDSVDASDYLDMDGASALVINTDDNDDSPNEGDDSKRSNTSKNKLESLLGKEFKHPRRKCGICGC